MSRLAKIVKEFLGIKLLDICTYILPCYHLCISDMSK